MKTTDTYHSFLLDHVNGALTPELDLAAELHVLLRDDARDVVDTWRCTRAVLSGGAESPDQAVRHRSQLPEALELSTGEFEMVPWKRGLSGVHYAKRGKGRGQLLRLDPGQAAPEHSHSVLEATVVLQGAFDDGHGVHRRGDLVIGAPGVSHRPAAVGDEMCVCYVGREPVPFWRLS